MPSIDDDMMPIQYTQKKKKKRFLEEDERVYFLIIIDRLNAIMVLTRNSFRLL